MDTQSESPEQTIILKELPEYWVAIHEGTGVGAQAPSRTEVLDELDDAVALHANTATEPIEEEDDVLRELGINPDEIQGDQPLPEVLR